MKPDSDVVERSSDRPFHESVNLDGIFKRSNPEDKPFTIHKKVQWYTFEDCKIVADKILEDHDFEEPMKYFLPTFIYSFKYNSGRNRPEGSLSWTFKEMYEHYIGKIYGMVDILKGEQGFTVSDGMHQYNRLENMSTEKERRRFFMNIYNESLLKKKNVVVF